MSILEKELSDTFNAWGESTKPKGLKQKFWMALNDLGLVTQHQKNLHLIDAAKAGNIQEIALWHKAGAKIHTHYDSAIKFAAQSGSKDCVEYLLKEGADPKNYYKRQPGDFDPESSAKWRAENLTELSADVAFAVAAGSGHTHLLKTLAAAHSLGDGYDKYVEGTFEVAVRYNRMDAVQHLATHFKDRISPETFVNAREIADTAEMKACLEPFRQDASAQISARKQEGYSRRPSPTAPFSPFVGS